MTSILSKQCEKKVQKFLTNAKFVRDMKIFIYQAKGGLNPVRTWTGPWFGPCPVHEWSSSGSALEEEGGVQVQQKVARTGPEPDSDNFTKLTSPFNSC